MISSLFIVILCVASLHTNTRFLTQPSDVVQSAFFNHRCALHVFECVNEEDPVEAATPLYIFPKAQATRVDSNGDTSVRFMCAFGRSSGNSTSHSKGFSFKHWLKIGEKYTSAKAVFGCAVDSDLEAIQSPKGQDLCILHEGKQQRVTYDALQALNKANGMSDNIRCESSLDTSGGQSPSSGFCHSAPKSFRDLPCVEHMEDSEYASDTVVYFDSGKDVTHRTQKRTSPSYPHGWCQAALFGDGTHSSAPAYASLIPFLRCPCAPIASVSFADDTDQFKRKFTHFEWKQGRRIRKKHIAGHPGYDHSFPYSCDQICAPHFGFTKKEIQTFPDRAAMLDAMQKRHALFERHENDPTKMCIIPKGARKTVGCRCAMQGKHRTPAKGTSRSFVSVSGKSPTILQSPSMVSASAPCVSESFTMPADWKAADFMQIEEKPEKESATKRILDEAIDETMDEGAESWFPFFLSFSYSAACGSGSTSAFCEWWDFLECLTQSTALALSTICDVFRWTF